MHESTSDPDARFHKKSYDKESKLACLGHALVRLTDEDLSAGAPILPRFS